MLSVLTLYLNFDLQGYFFMLIKFIIVLLLLSVLYNLGAGLIYLVKDQGHSDRTLRALTRRIALSMGVFILVMVAFATGLITPNVAP
jgi:hypothetical protein